MTEKPTYTFATIEREGGPSLADHNIYAALRGPIIVQFNVRHILCDPSMREWDSDCSPTMLNFSMTGDRTL